MVNCCSTDLSKASRPRTLSYRKKAKAIDGALLGSIEPERLPSKNLSIKRSLSRQLIVSSSSVNRTKPSGGRGDYAFISRVGRGDTSVDAAPPR